MNRFLVVSHSSGMAGAERSLLAIVTALRERGDEVIVTLPAPGPLAERLRALGPIAPQLHMIRTHQWMGPRQTGLRGIARLAQCAADLPAWRALVRRTAPDAVLVNTSVTPAALLVAVSQKLPVVTVVRESLRENPALRSIIPKLIMLRLIARSTIVVAVSQYVAGQIEISSRVIYPQMLYRPSTSDATVELLPEFALSIVMVGTVSAEKGQPMALRAVRMARDAGADVRLTIIGGGILADEQKLRREIVLLELEDSVEYCGESPDVSGAYSRHDYSLVCAGHEAFGKVTVESLVEGTPVIGFKRGGTKEILSQGGGILIEPNADSLAATLVELSKDRPRRAQLASEAMRHPVVAEVKRSTAAMVALMHEVCE